MYRLLPLVFLLFLYSCSGSTGPSGNDKTVVLDYTRTDARAGIEFNRTEYRIGKVVQGEKVGCQFIFRNTGTADLLLQDARASQSK